MRTGGSAPTTLAQVGARLRGWRRSPTLISALFSGLAGLLLFGALYATNPVLHDTDSSYHLQIARRYAAGDFSDHLSWTRRSLFTENFGDKELLFHLLLVPFAHGTDPMAGGRLFLTLLDALVLATLGALAARWLGRWGWLLPVGLVLLSVELDWRLVRLRPELLSLVLLLLAATAVAARRPRWLGVIAFAYALSYVAWHAFLGICGIWFLLYGILRREWDPLLVVYPLSGVGLGLLVHPQFPANLVVAWTVQVDYFRFKDVLDVGSEILPNTTDVLLFANLGLWIGLLVLWRCRQDTTGSSAPKDQAAYRADAERATIAYGAAAAVFGLLYFLMSRFSIYFLPLATLTLVTAVAARGQRISARMALVRGRALPIAAALTGLFLLSLPSLAREVLSYRRKTSPGPNNERTADRQAFGRAVPPGAKVAAPWGTTSLYLLYAPQGRYLNVLDPVLMAAHDPRSYAAQRGIFDGSTPDIPLALRQGLDSDFLAFSTVGASSRLLARVAHDPRLVERYRRFHALYEVQRGANAGFWLDWSRVPPGEPMPGGVFRIPSDWQRYPRLAAESGGDIEGFVDLARTGSRGCERLAHQWQTVTRQPLALEFAPSGPSALTLDGAPVVATSAALGAVLGQGLRLALAPEPGSHVVIVESCPDPANSWHGFFLRELGPD